MPLMHQRKGIRVGMIEAEHQQARGLARRAGNPVRFVHVAELMNEALAARGEMGAGAA